MKDKLKEILNTLYEAEGLMEMAVRRYDTSGREIARLAVEKCFQIADMAASINLPEADVCAEDVCGDENLPVYSALEDETSVACEAEAESASVSEDADYEDDDEQVIEVFTNEILPVMEANNEASLEEPDDEEAVPAEQALSEPDIEEQPAASGDASALAEADVPVDNEPEPQQSEPVYEDVQGPADTDDCRQENTQGALSDDSQGGRHADPMPEPEAVHRKPIISFFSLNDKFRFRRELFSNSEVVFRDALSLIEAMYDIGEACEYFYADLGWDPESEDVKAFIAVIERYFKS